MGVSEGDQPLMLILLKNFLFQPFYHQVYHQMIGLGGMIYKFPSCVRVVDFSYG